MWIVIEGEKGGGILDEIGEERKGGRGAKRVRIGFIAMRPRCTVISDVHTRWNSSTDRLAGDSPGTGTGYVTGTRSNTPRVESLRNTYRPPHAATVRQLHGDETRRREVVAPSANNIFMARRVGKMYTRRKAGYIGAR